MYGMLFLFRQFLAVPHYSRQANSPAAIAGLQSDSDYILGAESVLSQADDLIALVQANEGKSLKLYVYNVDTDGVREVSVLFSI